MTNGWRLPGLRPHRFDTAIVRMDLLLIVSPSSLDIVRSYLFISESIAKRLLF
jgi:hypothetical protein